MVMTKSNLVIGILASLALTACGQKDAINGVNGRDGSPGANGIDGVSCTQITVGGSEAAPNGGSLITCANGSVLIRNGYNGLNGRNGAPGLAGTNGTNGTDGTNGVDGTNGTNGTNGNDGAAGSNGADATPVVAINLCPNVSVYPSRFVESAFCIGNKLWGVYSLNGGFLTYLPEGNYSSNAVGSSCSFTIGANCSVTQ
jgi:hypothetical protein